MDGVTERETWRRQGEQCDCVGDQEQDQELLLGKWYFYGVGLGLDCADSWTVEGEKKLAKGERGEKGNGLPISAKL